MLSDRSLSGTPSHGRRTEWPVGSIGLGVPPLPGYLLLRTSGWRPALPRQCQGQWRCDGDGLSGSRCGSQLELPAALPGESESPPGSAQPGAGQPSLPRSASE